MEYPELRSWDGRPVSTEYLSEKSVAIYFFATNHSKCLSFSPFLLRHWHAVNMFFTDDKKSIGSSYNTLKKTGKNKIEVIVVSLDEDSSVFEKYVKANKFPWLYVQHGSNLAKNLIRKYSAYKEPELSRTSNFQYAPGLPDIVILRGDGRRGFKLDTSMSPQNCLKKWDFEAFRCEKILAL